MNDLKVLGTISRSHGLHGSVRVNVHASGAPELEKDEPVFILLQGGPVPFFVEECSISGLNRMVLKLESVDSVEQADKFVDCEVLLERSKFEAPVNDATNNLIGFSVTDAIFGDVGAVSGIMETAQHPILEVEREGKTILIPWVEEIIKEVDIESEQIHIEAPDGLIDLYING